MIRSSLMIAAVCLAAGSARSEEAAIKIAWTPKPAINLSDPRLSPGSLYAPRAASTPIPAGTVKTAIDGKLSPGVTGALGYLCGLEPGPNEKGGVVSTFDPVGTFLGGQLKVSF